MTIFNALPGITPSVRLYRMGQWPQRRMKMRNGRVAKWGLANRPSNDTIELSWENITYAQAELLCIVWDDNYGIHGSLNLPPTIPLTQEILDGMGTSLKQFVTTPFTGVTWHFKSPPTVESVKAGRCTVRMRAGTQAATYLP